MKRISAPPAPALSQDDQRWLDAFRRMDERRRHCNLIAMESQARLFPRVVKPTLRLVVGGAK